MVDFLKSEYEKERDMYKKLYDTISKNIENVESKSEKRSLALLKELKVAKKLAYEKYKQYANLAIEDKN